MGGDEARAIVSDAPYNLKIPGIVSGKGCKQHEDFVMASGEMKRDQFVDFLAAFLTVAKAHLIDGALSLVFMDWRHIGELLAAAEVAGMSYRQLLVWAKSNPALGGVWRNGHELIGVFKTGDAPHVNNVQLGRFGRNRSNVLHYPGANVLTKGRRKALELHPTVKPVALIADLILDVTEPSDIVLDCFGGSGTTLMAANAVDRKAYLSELDPKYVDVTLGRWLRHTGEQPILDETGQTFAEVSEARLAAGGEANDAA